MSCVDVLHAMTITSNMLLQIGSEARAEADVGSDSVNVAGAAEMEQLWGIQNLLTIDRQQTALASMGGPAGKMVFHS